MAEVISSNGIRGIVYGMCMRWNINEKREQTRRNVEEEKLYPRSDSFQGFE